MNTIMKFHSKDCELNIEICKNGNIIVSLEDGYGGGCFTVPPNEVGDFVEDISHLQDLVELVGMGENNE